MALPSVPSAVTAPSAPSAVTAGPAQSTAHSSGVFGATLASAILTLDSSIDLNTLASASNDAGAWQAAWGAGAAANVCPAS
jgi:hypothetical protein